MRHATATFRFQTPFFGRKTLTRLAMSDFQVQCAASKPFGGSSSKTPWTPQTGWGSTMFNSNCCNVSGSKGIFFLMHQILAWSPVQCFFLGMPYTHFLIPHPPLAWAPKCHSELMAELDGIFCKRLYQACSTRLKNSKFRHPLKDGTFYCKSFWSVPW